MRIILEKLLLAYTRWFPIKRGKYRLVEMFGRGIKGDEHVCTRRARLKYGSYQMDCDLRKMLQRQFYFFGTYHLEERVIARWSAFAKNASVILDIGANAGIFSLAAAAGNPAAKIHAFEPTPEIAAHFRKTIQQNGLGERITLHQAAVGRESGTAYLNFFSGEQNDNEGMNFVTAEERSASSIVVPTISIDDFCTRHGVAVIDLIKIDVQGNEPGVLAGAKNILRRQAIKVIFLELNWNRQNQSLCPASKVVNMLESAGYHFADPKSSERLEFRKAGSWLNVLSDVVAGSRP